MSHHLYENQMNTPWWKEITQESFEVLGAENLLHVASNTLLSHSISRGKEVLQFATNVLIKQDFFDDLLDKLNETFDARRIIRKFNVLGASVSEIYFWENGMLKVSRSDGLSIEGEMTDLLETGKLKNVPELSYDPSSFYEGSTNSAVVSEIEIMTMNPHDLKDLLEIIHSNGVPYEAPVHKHPGSAYVMALTLTGIRLIPVGLSGKSLERDNYSEKALISFDRAVRDFGNDCPRGRLTVLEGPPGTGKTHMVRGFLAECPAARFVFIQPSILANLADPGMIPTFIGEMQGPGPIILVLEDADACLSERKENMNSIQAMLNLSDGVLGGLFDLRILATTNAKIEEFDKALLRPGRLSERIYLGDLGVEQAKMVWERIAGKNRYPFNKEDVSLAAIYAHKGELIESELIKAEIAELKEKKILN